MALNYTEVMLGLALGGLLAIIFFGGLWLTVRGVSTSPAPRKRLLMSFLLRSAVTCGGLVLALRLGHTVFFSAIIAFFVGREIILRTAKARIRAGSGEKP